MGSDLRVLGRRRRGGGPAEDRGERRKLVEETKVHPGLYSQEERHFFSSHDIHNYVVNQEIDGRFP